MPPAGLVPSTTTLGAILRRHEAALGRLTPGLADTTHETWTVDEAGLRGSETLVRSGLDYHSVLDRGPFHEEFGKRGDAGWHLGPNGVVSALKHEDFESFFMQRVLEDASDPKNDVNVLGLTADGADDVVQIRRANSKHAEYEFLDAKTGYVVKTDQVIDGERLVSTYDDYRVTNGFARPWHVRDQEQTTGVVYDYRLTALTAGDAVDPVSFQAPPSVFRPGTLTTSGILPSSVKFASVVVRLMVAGRGLDFELSSGSPRSYIDVNVARELNLPTYGQTLTSNDGKPLGFDTTIADATIGPMALHDFAVRAVDVSYEPSEDTKIVGVLGTDFLRSGTFTLDYVNAQVEGQPSSDATFPLGPDAIEVPVHFDDGKALIAATIAGHEASDVLLDNAWLFTTIFGSFSARFPESVPEIDGHQHQRANLPFADSKSYGREADIWVSKLPEMRFGETSFHDFAVLATNEDGDDDVDGVIGMSLLDDFDVQLDFAHDRVVLRKNKFFDYSFRKRSHS